MIGTWLRPWRGGVRGHPDLGQVTSRGRANLGPADARDDASDSIELQASRNHSGNHSLPAEMTTLGQDGCVPLAVLGVRVHPKGGFPWLISGASRFSRSVHLGSSWMSGSGTSRALFSWVNAPGTRVLFGLPSLHAGVWTRCQRWV
jgi:hypothetical protein